MSGDVQTRQRRKEKKKQKRDSVDQQALLKRFSFSEDEAPLPGIDTSKFNETEKKSVQMHINEGDHHGDHGAGICAKIIFFTLMAILLGLVTLIVLENRGGSDVDTPLSESRFSEYLQGWVDENRQDDHHDEPHISAPDHDEEHDDNDQVAEDHDHDDHTEINDDEPYPEEKDVSNDENDDEENSQELNAEINDNASQENDHDDDNNDQNNDEPEETNDDGNNSLEDTNNNEPEVPNLFEDSAPFDEEGDDEEGIADSKDIFENVVDNDEGEEILLQKLAEESEQEQNQQQDLDENEGEGSSSQIPEDGGAQSSYMEELLRQQALEENY